MTDLEARLDRALRAPITTATWKRVGNLPVPGPARLDEIAQSTRDPATLRIIDRILRQDAVHGGTAYDLTTLRGVAMLPYVGPVAIRALARALGYGELETAGCAHAREGR